MKRAKLHALLAKIEAVEGTDAVPDPATDGIQLEESLWSQIEVDYLERNLRENANGSRMGRQAGAEPAGRWAKVTAVVALKGAGAAYAAAVRPELDALLRAAGLGATVDATLGSESVTYAMLDEAHESATVYAFAGGACYKLVGCHARITSISLIPARFGVVTFEITGRLPELPTDTAIPAIAYPHRGVQPPVVREQGLDLDGYNAPFKSVDFDQQLELATAPRGGAPDGHAGYAISDIDPQLKVQLDAPNKAAFNPWDLESSFARLAWSVSTGGVQYNHATLAGSAGQIIKIGQAEDSNLAMIDLTLRALIGDAEEDAFTLTFD